MGQGASLATPADPLVQRQNSGRAASDGKPRQENPWCGPRNLGHPREEDTGRTRTQAQGLSTSAPPTCIQDRKSTRLNSSHVAISYAVFCLKKKLPMMFIL